MPSISSCLLFDGVTETVVPGQTRISPPRDKARTAVSEVAVTEAPAPMRLPASTTVPGPPDTGTTAGAEAVARVDAAGGGVFWRESALELESPAGFRRIIRRFPAASQV